MGLGGHLIWTALAREITERNPSVKLLPIELHGNLLKLIKSPAYQNNPRILQEFIDNDQFVLPMVMNDPDTNYCAEDTPTKAYHKSGRHMIETLCLKYGIQNPKIECEIFFTETEEKEIDLLIRKTNLSNKFVCIEPYSKDNYTPNRKYDFSKWQQVVNELSKKTDVVQLGNAGSPILKNIKSLVGKTSFRQACLMLKRSTLFLSCESGLVHAASATKTPTIVILTGYQSKKMVEYPRHTYIDISSHGPCGLKIECEKCKSDVSKHDVTEITDVALERLGLK